MELTTTSFDEMYQPRLDLWTLMPPFSRACSDQPYCGEEMSLSSIESHER
jgi:hypothetical protein